MVKARDFDSRIAGSNPAVSANVVCIRPGEMIETENCTGASGANTAHESTLNMV